MAKSAIRGITTSYRGAKRVRHTHYTIVAIGEGTDPATLVGAKVLWTLGASLACWGRSWPAMAGGAR